MQPSPSSSKASPLQLLADEIKQQLGPVTVPAPMAAAAASAASVEDDDDHKEKKTSLAELDAKVTDPLIDFAYELYSQLPWFEFEKLEKKHIAEIKASSAVLRRIPDATWQQIKALPVKEFKELIVLKIVNKLPPKAKAVLHQRLLTMHIQKLFAQSTSPQEYEHLFLNSLLWLSVMLGSLPESRDGAPISSPLRPVLSKLTQAPRAIFHPKQVSNFLLPLNLESFDMLIDSWQKIIYQSLNAAKKNEFEVAWRTILPVVRSLLIAKQEVTASTLLDLLDKHWPSWRNSLMPEAEVVSPAEAAAAELKEKKQASALHTPAIRDLKSAIEERIQSIPSLSGSGVVAKKGKAKILAYTDTDASFEHFEHLATTYLEEWQEHNLESHGGMIPSQNLIFNLLRALEKLDGIELSRSTQLPYFIYTYEERHCIPLAEDKKLAEEESDSEALVPKRRKTAEHPDKLALNFLIDAAAIHAMLELMLAYLQQEKPKSKADSIKHDSKETKETKALKAVAKVDKTEVIIKLNTVLVNIIKQASDKNSPLRTTPYLARVAYGTQIKSILLSYHIDVGDYNKFWELAYNLWSAVQIPVIHRHIWWDSKLNILKKKDAKPILTRPKIHESHLVELKQGFLDNSAYPHEPLRAYFILGSDNVFYEVMLRAAINRGLTGVWAPGLGKFTQLYPKYYYLIHDTMQWQLNNRVYFSGFTYARGGGLSAEVEPTIHPVLARDVAPSEENSTPAYIGKTYAENNYFAVIRNLPKATPTLIMALSGMFTTKTLTPKKGYEHRISAATLSICETFSAAEEPRCPTYAVCVPLFDDKFGRAFSKICNNPQVENLLTLFTSIGVTINSKYFPGLESKKAIDMIVLSGQLTTMFKLGIWLIADKQFADLGIDGIDNRGDFYNKIIIPILLGKVVPVINESQNNKIRTLLKLSQAIVFLIIHCLSGKDRTSMTAMYLDADMKKVLLYFTGIHHFMKASSSYHLNEDQNSNANTHFIKSAYPGVAGILRKSFPADSVGQEAKIQTFSQVVFNQIFLSYASLYYKYVFGGKGIAKLDENVAHPSADPTSIVVASTVAARTPAAALPNKEEWTLLGYYFNQQKLLYKLRDLMGFLITLSSPPQVEAIKQVLAAFGIKPGDPCPQIIFNLLPEDQRDDWGLIVYPAPILEECIKSVAELKQISPRQAVTLLTEQLPHNLRERWPDHRHDDATDSDDKVCILLVELGVLTKNDGQWSINQKVDINVVWKKLKEFFQYPLWLINSADGVNDLFEVLSSPSVLGSADKLLNLIINIINDPIATQILEIFSNRRPPTHIVTTASRKNKFKFPTIELDDGVEFQTPKSKNKSKDLPEQKEAQKRFPFASTIKLDVYSAEYRYYMAVINTHLNMLTADKTRTPYNVWNFVNEWSWFFLYIQNTDADSMDQKEEPQVHLKEHEFQANNICALLKKKHSYQDIKETFNAIWDEKKPQKPKSLPLPKSAASLQNLSSSLISSPSASSASLSIFSPPPSSPPASSAPAAISSEDKHKRVIRRFNILLRWCDCDLSIPIPASATELKEKAKQCRTLLLELAIHITGVEVIVKEIEAELREVDSVAMAEIPALAASAGASSSASESVGVIPTSVSSLSSSSSSSLFSSASATSAVASFSSTASTSSSSNSEVVSGSSPSLIVLE